MSVRSRMPALGLVAVLAASLLIGCTSETSSPEAETAVTPPPVSPAPTAPPPPSAEELRRERAEAWVAEASTRQLAGSVIMATLPSADPALLHSFMAETGLGGFILMGTNVPGGPEETQQLVAMLSADSTLPPLIAIDQEGGEVTRLPWDEFAGPNMLRQLPASDAETAYRARGHLLAAVGINVNFGIVADVSHDPWDFIHWRTLGDDPWNAAERVAAAVSGERGQVASTLKHFPGHGAVSGDSHFAIPSTSLPFDTWRENEALPFEAGIDAGAELLMFGHLSFTEVTSTPASLAPEWYAIARAELGFEGVTITDDLSMLQASGVIEYQDPAANAVAALAAGADMALFVSGMDHDTVTAILDQVTAAIDSGALAEDRVREAATRVVELRLELGR